MIGKHVVIDTLDNFKTKLSLIPSSAIVLIKDVGQIYAHGTYFGAQKTYSLLTKTADGLAPKGGTSASSLIKDGETEWVLTVTNGENPSWRRLPDNAFNSLQYTLPAATTTELGGIKVGKLYTATFSDLVGKYYKINIDKDGLAYVEVPWTDNDYRVEQVNTSVLDEDFRVTFSGTATNDTKTETLRKSSKLLFNPVSGKLTSTTFEGNLDGNYINKLTGYAIAKQEAAISVNDSLNLALGKLEYKLDSAYNWYKGVVGTDEDKVINKWDEIVDFVKNVSEGTDLVNEFVTRKTDLIILGQKTFVTNANTTPLKISRLQSINTEYLSIGVDDHNAVFNLKQDEKEGNYFFGSDWSNLSDEGDGALAGRGYVKFVLNNLEQNIYVSNGTDVNKVLHSDNYNNYSPKLDGTGATGDWNINIKGSSSYLIHNTTKNTNKYGSLQFYYGHSTPYGDDVDEWNSPYGEYENNSIKCDYGSILRVRYSPIYYHDLWFDANLKSISFRQIKSNVSLGWKTLLDSGNFSEYLDDSYVKKTGDVISGLLEFSSTTYPHIYGNGNYLILGPSNQTIYGLVIGSGYIRSHHDNHQTIGVADNRWSNIYSVLGNFSGLITSTVADGTAPFVVASKTCVVNLNADTVDGMHVNTNPMGNTYGKIPSISSENGVIEIGRYVDFHSDNTTSLDYSTRIQSEGNNGNVLKLPTTSGTLALTTDSMQSINVLLDINSNSEYPIIWSNSNNSDSESAKLHKSYDYLTYNPNQKILSSTYFKGYLTSSVPSNIKHSLVYTSGIYKSPKAFEGSSPDYSVLSYPKGGTYMNSDGQLNIINLRFMWNNQYWHDIFMSPNRTYLYHRRNDSTTEGRPWARIVEESSSEIWDIISTNSTKLGGYESTRFVRKEVLNTNYNFDANSLNTDCMIYTPTGDLLEKAPTWDNFPYSVLPAGGFSLFTIHEGSYQRQLFGKYNDSHLYTRTQQYDSTTGKPGWKYWETIALLSDIPTYYWADINISKTPNSNTTPTFAKVTSKQFYYNLTVDSLDPIFYVGSDNKDVTLFRVYSSGAEDTGYLASHGYSLVYTGSLSDSNNKLQLLADNGSATKQIVALSINNTGQIGIKTDADQSYSLKVEGKIRSDNEVIVNNPNAFRIIYGDYGVIQRIDTSNYFLLLTNKGDTLGSFNTLRPFTMNLEKGTISIANLESSNNIYAKGFSKTNSNDTYVLLGGGGHKSLSDFTLANTTTFAKTLDVTQDWMDTGIKHDDLTTGTYVVQVYVNALDSTGYMYDCYWSGIMSWYSGKVYSKTNDDETDEILLHRSGHAYNNTIYLRTIMSASDTNLGLRLQIAASKNITKLYSYKFTFKKMI